MKHVFLFALILPMLCSVIFCDEIAYVVTQDTSMKNRYSSGSRTTVTRGETVFFQGEIRPIYPSNPREFEMCVSTRQGGEWWINSNNILLQGNQPLSDSVAVRYWIFSYYQDIIFEQQRESLYKYEPFRRDQYYDAVKDSYMVNEPWWLYFFPTTFSIRNNFVHIDNIFIGDCLYFATTEQEQDNTVILIQCICIKKRSSLLQSHWSTTFNEGETYLFIIKVNGDYIDVFLNNNPVKICTLIGVDEYFAKVVQGIVQGDSVDLTRIVWPRRADGSMDYPPPLGIDMTRSYIDIFPIIEEPLPILNINDTTTEVSQTDEAIQSGKGSQSLPLWALIAIIGGAVVVAGGVALFIIKRKK